MAYRDFTNLEDSGFTEVVEDSIPRFKPELGKVKRAFLYTAENPKILATHWHAKLGTFKCISTPDHEAACCTYLKDPRPKYAFFIMEYYCKDNGEVHKEALDPTEPPKIKALFLSLQKRNELVKVINESGCDIRSMDIIITGKKPANNSSRYVDMEFRVESSAVLHQEQYRDICTKAMERFQDYQNTVRDRGVLVHDEDKITKMIESANNAGGFSGGFSAPQGGGFSMPQQPPQQQYQPPQQHQYQPPQQPQYQPPQQAAPTQEAAQPQPGGAPNVGLGASELINDFFGGDS